MKKQLKKFFAIIALITLTTELFGAETPKEYVGLPIRNFDELKQKQPSYYEAWILAKKPSDLKALSETVKKLLSATPAELAKLTTNGGAKRAAKFLKMARLSEKSLDVSRAVKVGNFVIIAFDLPKKTRLREGMNALVFEKSGDNFLYNPSFNDPLVALIATSDFKNPVATIELKYFSDADKKMCETLVEKELPILCFKNGALVSESVVEGVDNIQAAKFYRNAQDIFYDWKLDDYADFMTPFSANKFNSQFKSMSEAERKKVLGEYFKWKKQYHKFLDAGTEKLILFSRHKPQFEPYDDTAYISSKNGKFAITKFGAEKSPLDLFFSKYIYPKDGYLKLISNKYCNK